MTGAAEELPHADDSHLGLSDRPQAFFNALLTEHFVLASARGITVSESSARAGLYMTTLTSSAVAYGFLSGTRAAPAFLAALLPMLFLFGLTTFERLVATGLEDVVALAAIQRIRRWYGKLLPGAEEYFPVPTGDQAALNELLDIRSRSGRRGVLFTVAAGIAGVNSIVAGLGAATAARALGSSIPLAVTTAVVVAATALVLHLLFQQRRFREVMSTLRPQP